MFDCVVCGVDATPESLDACRQAARLRTLGGSLFLVAVADVRAAAQAGFEAVYATDQIRDEAGEALACAKETVQEHTQGLVVEGSTVSALLDVAVREEATLIMVGAHKHSRTAELLLGSTALALVRDAPCSVLVARAVAEQPELFPRSIVVGLDGSSQSAAAAVAATDLAVELGGEVSGVVAKGGKGVDLDSATAHPFHVEVVDGVPVDALKRRAEAADLVVVGSRGLHGLRALGSVSERIANAAPCSVLVVR